MERKHYKSDFLLWRNERDFVNRFCHIGIALIWEWRKEFAVKVSLLSEWRHISEWDMAWNDTMVWTENNVNEETKTGRRGVSVRVGEWCHLFPLRRANAN